MGRNKDIRFECTKADDMNLFELIMFCDVSIVIFAM